VTGALIQPFQGLWLFMDVPRVASAARPCASDYFSVLRADRRIVITGGFRHRLISHRPSGPKEVAPTNYAESVYYAALDGVGTLLPAIELPGQLRSQMEFGNERVTQESRLLEFESSN
jgi:hypothetical protein